jgi:hypothetical protein
MLIIGSLLLLLPQMPLNLSSSEVYATAIITRVQHASNYTKTAPLELTLTNSPTVGDVLVAAVGTDSISSAVSVSSISETGTTWVKAVKSYYDYWVSEIWWANVTSTSLSKTISISYNTTLSDYTSADVCEYSGPITVDKTATNGGASGNPSTGTTSLTSLPNELCVGCTTADLIGQTTASNSFTLLDGTLHGYESEAYLEYIASSQLKANSTTNGNSGNRWSGCIATFMPKPISVSNVGATALIMGMPSTFHTEWNASPSTLSKFIFGCNNTGHWVNTTYSFSGSPTTAWSNVTISALNSTLSTNPVYWTIHGLPSITYEFWANNSADLWSNTGKQTFETVGPTMTTTQMTNTMFADMIKAEVNSTFPYVYQASENLTASNYVTAEPLQAITMFAQSGNVTYLNAAEAVGNWLEKQSDIRLVFIGYNFMTHSWDKTYGTVNVGNYLGYLALLASFNSSYQNLVQKAVDIALLCISPASGSPYYSMNMTNNQPVGTITYIDAEYALADGLTYASSVLHNSTIENIAYNLITKWYCGTPSSGCLIPAYEELYNGTACNDAGETGVTANPLPYTKEDEGIAEYLYSCEEFLYLYQSNSTMKTRIQEVATATAKYLWDSTNEYWVYRIYVANGSLIAPSGLYTWSVHGFGMTDEAMFIAGLLFNNQTWINCAKQDYTTNVINKGLITNGLIDHQVDVLEAENQWNQYARRFGIEFYDYNGSNIFYKTANWLFENVTTKGARPLGWSGDLWTIPPYNDYPKSLSAEDNIPIPFVSASIFINRTNVKITSNWTTVFFFFGFPQWGNAPVLGAQATSKTTPVKIIFLEGPFYTEYGIEYWIVKLSGRPPMRIIINYW